MYFSVFERRFRKTLSNPSVPQFPLPPVSSPFALSSFVPQFPLSSPGPLILESRELRYLFCWA